MLSVNDKLSTKDSIGLGRKGTINKPQFLKEPFWTVDTLFFLTPFNNYDIQYIYAIIQKINWLKMNEASGVPSLSKTTIEETYQYFPIYGEQEKIGKLLKLINADILLQKQQLLMYRKIKEALLQQMFVSDGDLVPKVRFADFHGNWEQHKLGDFLKIPQNEKIKIKSSNQLMTVKLNVGGIVYGGNRETLSLGSTTYYKRHMGQLIYGKQNFFNGSIAIVPDTMDGKATSGDVPSFDISNSINSNFLFDVISRRDYWKSKEAYSTGTGSKRIHEQTFLNFDITVANSSTEQQKIVKIISLLNGLISALQIKLDRTVSLKKFMLQKLFI